MEIFYHSNRLDDTKYDRSTAHLEGLTINQPLMIETVDEKEKIEPLLEPLKRLIGDNGFITFH
ncbi:MAG: DUF190 domain-containing protein [Thermoproteota archaeon]|nr:DUF190 domain-containing protein [Thermoproteota archaeon]